jgi:enoyl-CoA hydratase
MSKHDDRSAATVRVEHDGPVTIVSIDRPEARNAVDGPTSVLLADAFRAFDKDDERLVAVLTGVDSTFCAGADLKGISDGRGNPVREQGDGPMGPSRMLLSKPVIAAVEGYAIAGGPSCCGATCAPPRPTRCSGCSAAAGVCR